jgi:hypothetical protein
MKCLLLATLAGLATAGLIAAAPASGGTPVSAKAAHFVAKEFSFTASCTIKCVGGQCKPYCESGSIFAIDERDAQLKAELKLRQDASREGTVVEGTVSVFVTLKF